MVEKNLDQMGGVLRLNSHPEIPIGSHCNDPYECPLQSLCWKDVPEDSVFKLTGVRKKTAFEWFFKGHRRLADLSGKVRLTSKQTIQVEATQSGRPFVDSKAIRAFLASLQYPLYFLDFETFSTAIPLVDNCRPYQQIPFQYSLHILEREGGKPKHHSFLADGRHDPRMEFLEWLKSLLGTRGSVVAYNATFERQRLQECCEIYPEFKPWLKGVENRIVDLLTPFRSFHYYHPDQMGSASLKGVLPVLTGKSYENLEINDGNVASREFLRITFKEVEAAEKQRVRRQLEKYCSLDTMGMTLIVDRLKKLSVRG